MKLESPSGSDQKIPSLFEAVTNAVPAQEYDPPLDLVKFRSLSEFDRARTGPEFFTKEHIKEFLEKKWKRELHNDTSYWWLLQIKKDTTDPGKLTRIGTRLRQFAKAIHETNHPFEGFKRDVSKYL